MNKNSGVNLWHRAGRIAAGILFTIFLSLFGTNVAQAGEIWANKGFLIDAGGAPSSAATPYFVGQLWWDQSARGFEIWDYNGNLKYLPPGSQYAKPGFGCSAFVNGSAVYFNGSLYAFAPFIKDTGSSGSYIGMTDIHVIDPATSIDFPDGTSRWALTSFETLALHEMDHPFDMKNGIGAAVANGRIYLFTTGKSTGGPVVYSSSNGQDWAKVSATNDPKYPVVHDAITFIDPKDGKTKIMVVLSAVASDASVVFPFYPMIPAVSIYDPETDSWGTVSPMPQGTLPDGTYGMYACAWFGSWKATINNNWGGCNWYSWNSGNTDAYLHVLGAVWTGTTDYLVHWYFDPTTGSWMLDPSGCESEHQAIWWAKAPMAVGPGYMKSTSSGCQSGDDCLQQVMYWMSEGLSTFSVHSRTLGYYSDLWVPTTAWHGKGTKQSGPWSYNTISTSNPSDPAYGNDPAIYNSMAGMIRIDGIVMGPPPFPISPDWENPGEWSETSNVQLGRSSEISSGTSSTFDYSVSAGIETQVSAPCVKAKSGLSFTYGHSSTHSTENSFKSSYEWTLGTMDQTRETLGKQGWMVGQAPIIFPRSYIATSARDPGPTGTYMGYDQMLLSVGEAHSLFWPFSLTNPSDTSYPMGFLLSGVKPMPASTDVESWSVNTTGSVMQDWSDTSKNDWLVIGGKAGSGKFPINVLNMGSRQTQQFVKSKTDSSRWSDNYKTDASTSVSVSAGILKFTTKLDVSVGYETEGSSSTTMEENMETSYLIPSFQGGFSEIYVQPYLLQATTRNAPWVPKGYRGPLPWAITWDVIYVAKKSSTQSSHIGASETAATIPDTIFGRTTMPLEASGRITGTAEPNYPSAANTDRIVVDNVRDDTYAITKGQLSYIGLDHSNIPIAMTAGDFDPSAGICITINDYKLYATSAKGIWSRSSTPGNVWTYASRYGTERLEVTLDFGSMTWDMAVSDIELGDKFAGVNDTAVITLDLNHRYVLSTRIVHSMMYEWQADLSSFTQAMEMNTINVQQGSTGPGVVIVMGRLTDQVRSVGDVSIVLNASHKDYNLMNLPDFMEIVNKKRFVFYGDETGILVANLETGYWAITADTYALPNPLPMYHGEAELKVLIGGKEYFSAYIHPDSYVVDLSYKLLK